MSSSRTVVTVALPRIADILGPLFRPERTVRIPPWRKRLGLQALRHSPLSFSTDHADRVSKCSTNRIRPADPGHDWSWQQMLHVFLSYSDTPTNPGRS